MRTAQIGPDLRLLTLSCLIPAVLASCVYFFTTENVADVKLETDIVEKRLFAVKEKTTCYTLSLTTIMLWSRMSCFVINDSLGFWLKCYFTCKLGCMLLSTTVCFEISSMFYGVLACVAGTLTSVHCFFSQTCLWYALKTWFKLSRVKL